MASRGVIMIELLEKPLQMLVEKGLDQEKDKVMVPRRTVAETD